METFEKNESERIFTEIASLREQWQAEVGEGRKIWPNAIKLRVLDLMLSHKINSREIANRTDISYETINLWKHKQKKKRLQMPGFKELAVSREEKSATVTVTEEMQGLQTGNSITVKTPRGYVFEGLNGSQFAELIKCLGGLRVL